MRLHLWLMAACLLQSATAQTVTLRNVSFPFTAIEVGNTVEVKITGAAPFGTVELTHFDFPPTTIGLTDASGNWSIQAVELPVHVGSYVQTWSVNETPMTPDNASSTFFPFAPRLPSFTVYSNYQGSNCPPASPLGSACGNSSSGRRWLWGPVTYESFSAVASLSAINSSANQWSSIQSKIDFSSFSTVRQDVRIADANLQGNILGVTIPYGQDCFNPSCIGFRTVCTGACTTLDGVGWVDIFLNGPQVSAHAAAQGVPQGTVALRLVQHELGHALRLGHTSSLNGRCSAVDSIMFPSLSVLLGCGITGPTTCDGSALNSLYPSVVPVCSVFTGAACNPSNPC